MDAALRAAAVCRPAAPPAALRARARRAAASTCAARRGARLLCRAESEDKNLFEKLKDIIPRDEEGKDDGKGGRELTKGSLIELIGFGLGAPVPSEVRFDKENLRVYMDFEANNFEKNGKYRDEGWVDDTPPGPSLWSRLFGGGKDADKEE